MSTPPPPTAPSPNDEVVLGSAIHSTYNPQPAEENTVEQPTQQLQIGASLGANGHSDGPLLLSFAPFVLQPPSLGPLLPPPMMASTNQDQHHEFLAEALGAEDSEWASTPATGGGQAPAPCRSPTLAQRYAFRQTHSPDQVMPNERASP